MLEKEDGHSFNSSFMDSDHAIKEESDAVNSDWSGDSHHLGHTKNRNFASDDDDDDDMSASISGEHEVIGVLGRKRSRENSEYEEISADDRPRKLRALLNRSDNMIAAQV